MEQVIGDLVVRQAGSRFEIDALRQRVRRARRDGDVFRIAARAHRKVTALMNTFWPTFLSDTSEPVSAIVPLISMPGIAGNGGIQA
jgi:hypothetical protein